VAISKLATALLRMHHPDKMADLVCDRVGSVNARVFDERAGLTRYTDLAELGHAKSLTDLPRLAYVLFGDQDAHVGFGQSPGGD